MAETHTVAGNSPNARPLQLGHQLAMLTDPAIPAFSSMTPYRALQYSCELGGRHTARRFHTSTPKTNGTGMFQPRPGCWEGHVSFPLGTCPLATFQASASLTPAAATPSFPLLPTPYPPCGKGNTLRPLGNPMPLVLPPRHHHLSPRQPGSLHGHASHPDPASVHILPCPVRAASHVPAPCRAAPVLKDVDRSLPPRPQLVPKLPRAPAAAQWAAPPCMRHSRQGLFHGWCGVLMGTKLQIDPIHMCRTPIHPRHLPVLPLLRGSPAVPCCGHLLACSSRQPSVQNVKWQIRQSTYASLGNRATASAHHITYLTRQPHRTPGRRLPPPDCIHALCIHASCAYQ